MKDAYWFKHDSNAKDDPKCVLLIEQLGLEGFGIYWVLIEILREQPNYHYPLALIPSIARRYNTSTQKVEAVVKGYGLFATDGEEFFFSESLISRMKPLEERKDQARIAGLASAEKRRKQASLNERSTDVQQTFNRRSTIREDKIREDKSISKQKHGEFQNVLLTDDEYKKLQSKFPDYKNKIEKLSEYVASKGIKYKSHYATILSWSRKEEPELKKVGGDEIPWI